MQDKTTTRNISQKPLIDLWNYWNSKRGIRRMPARADLNPADIPEILPYIYLLDVLHEPVRFRARLLGTSVRDFIGRDATGVMLDEKLYGDETEDALSILRIVVDTKAPVGIWGPETLRETEWEEKEAIILPLSNDGERVDMLLGGNVGTKPWAPGAQRYRAKTKDVLVISDPQIGTPS
jgi:hypothetical protein